jgi:hypothetical protein
MACMSNRCTKCDWEDFENRRRSYCPECGAPVVCDFDERPSGREEEDDDDEEDWE